MGSEAPFGHGQKQSATWAHRSSEANLHGHHGTVEPIKLRSQHRHRRAAGEATKLPKNHKIFPGRLAQWRPGST